MSRYTPYVPPSYGWLSTCDVSDALVKKGQRNGGLLPGIRPSHNKCKNIHGPAFTVKFVPIEDSSGPKIVGHWVDQVRPGSVIVISQPEPHFAAVVGGMVATRAKYLGAKGIIIDGFFRDVEEIEILGVSIYAKGSSTIGSGGYYRVAAVDAEISINSPYGMITVNPNDQIIADRDGVVCIKQSLLCDVCPLIEELRSVDKKVMHDIRTGSRVDDALQTYRG